MNILWIIKIERCWADHFQIMTYDLVARREFEEFLRLSECYLPWPRWRRSRLSRLPGRWYSCHGAPICFHYSVSLMAHTWPNPGCLAQTAIISRPSLGLSSDDSLWSPHSTPNCLFSLDQWNNPNLSTTWQNILWARLGPMEMFIQSQSVVDINSVGISKSYSRYTY